MSRPDFTYSGNGSKFSFNLPPGWFAVITSMEGTFANQNSLSIVPQVIKMHIEVEFYASPQTRVADSEELVNRDMNANQLHIVKTQKRPGAPGADFITLCAFVQDTRTTPSNGAYNNAVGFIHLGLGAAG
ncbi:hypothetical protein B0H10DRAFT_1944801 [Mycena sp. CBHHK59/15]|nr:hypothetical protein B0H10DRAFT_1944801 [Mycena sp. CBHHK59/15]